MLNAIIIDDVPQARETLKEDLETYCPQVKIIGEAEGVVSGAKLLRNKKPDILFLDIQMQDGSGFDLLEILPEISFKVIFTTASDAFAIKAFRYAALDYLLKPIDPDLLIEAVQKAETKSAGQEESLELLKENLQPNHTPRRLALHTSDKIHITEISDIVRCESSGNYTNFHFTNNKKLLVTKTLKEFDKLLDDQGFMRVHQSHLINTSQIQEFVKTDGGYLVMKDKTKIPVSTRKRPIVVKLLENL